MITGSDEEWLGAIVRNFRNNMTATFNRVGSEENVVHWRGSNGRHKLMKVDWDPQMEGSGGDMSVTCPLLKHV